MSKDFAVVITRVSTNFTLDEAIKLALSCREVGFGSEVIPMSEANARIFAPQQDLTVVEKAWKERK